MKSLESLGLCGGEVISVMLAMLKDVRLLSFIFISDCFDGRGILDNLNPLPYKMP